MTVYIIAIVLILGLWEFLKRNSNGKKIYCTTVSIYLFLLAGLRNPALGMNDTLYYTELYPILRNMSFSDIMNYGFSDPGFEVFAKILTYISSDPQIWIFVSAIPLAIGVGQLIYNKSEHPDMSFILFLALGYYCYEYTMMRQMMAVGFGLLAYLQYDKKKYMKAIILLLLASSIHLTSLVLLLIPIADHFRIKNHWKMIAFVGIPVLFSNSDLIIKKIFSFLNSYRFTRYSDHLSSFNYTLFYIHLMILAVAFLLYWKSTKNQQKYSNEIIECAHQNELTAVQEEYNMLFLCAVVNVILLVLIKQFALLYRVAAYFGVFEIVLLPNSVKYSRSEATTYIITSGINITFIVYFLFFTLTTWFMMPYAFFWDSVFEPLYE